MLKETRLETVQKEIQRSNHFKAYYEDQSLLVQFVLTEFVNAHHLTTQMQPLMDHYCESETHSELTLSQLNRLGGQLVGCFSNHKQFSFSRWSQGSLSKLKEYSEKLSIQTQNQNVQFTNLQMITRQAWINGVHNLELLTSLQEFFPKTERHLVLRAKFKKAFKNLTSSFSRIARQIPLIVRQYWQNENVVLCLLRHHAPLMTIYGNTHLYKKFKWPSKITLKEHLDRRYLERGFVTLIPIINQIFTREPSCSPVD